MSESYIKLSLLNQLIQEAVEGSFVEDVWLIAEIADIRTAASGHCYLELVEKKNDKIVARMRANIWSFQYAKIASNFLNVTGKNLEKGMKVLLLAGVGFHELYGMSLVIKNVNPEYTLGDLERNKKEILDRLRREGMLEKNSRLEMNIIPKRIAIVSSESAAGYEDFMNQLTNNEKEYVFECTKFDAIMQGEKSSASVVQALQQIALRKVDFDVVVIIRGGGASLDLVAFDSYELAVEAANFPLPVISGIGHERDFSILDQVAHTRAKTPTAAAEFLIQQFDDFNEHIKELRDALIYNVRDRLRKEKNKETKYRSNFAFICQSFLNAKKEGVDEIRNAVAHKTEKYFLNRKNEEKVLAAALNVKAISLIQRSEVTLLRRKEQLKTSSKLLLEKEKMKLKMNAKSLNLVDPINVLQRGFVLVKNSSGRIVKSVQDVSVNEVLNVSFKDGSVPTKVIKNEE